MVIAVWRFVAIEGKPDNDKKWPKIHLYQQKITTKRKDIERENDKFTICRFLVRSCWCTLNRDETKWWKSGNHHNLMFNETSKDLLLITCKLFKGKS